MPRKQLITLFVCSLSTWIVFQSLISLLPVYAVRLGADPAQIGTYLAIGFAALTCGSLSSGVLSNRLQRRKAVLMLTALLNVPVTWLMSQAVVFWQLVVLTALVLFIAGIGLGTTSILAGLFAGDNERGKIFGILGINLSLGSLIGGSFSGSIVERWGFPALFVIASLFWIVQFVAAQFLQDKPFVAPEPKTADAAHSKPALGRMFYLLLFANIVAFASGFVALLARPLRMDALAFTPSAISGVVAIGGAVTLPFPILLGWLSDRIDRYLLVVLCFVFAASGLVVLAVSTDLWHFGAATILLSGVGISVGIGQAMVVDLVPREALAAALSRYGTVGSIGAVIGFSISGFAIETLGMTNTLLAGVVFTLLAIALLFWIRSVNSARLQEA